MQLEVRRPLYSFLLTTAAAALLLPAVAAANFADDLSTAKAPVAPDGLTAGAPTDFVISFRDPNPDVRGLGLRAGATIEIELSPEFTPGDPPPPAANNVIILQGWPQSPPTPPFPWTIDFAGNRITLTLTADYRPGDLGPGPKSLHLLLLGYTNPVKPGVYPIALSVHPNPAISWNPRGTAYVRITADAPPSIEPVSLFSGPPGPPPPFFNPFYQTLALGEAARPVGLYIWDANGVAFEGVDLMPGPTPGLTYYQLTQMGVVVGEAWITAPPGASNFSLSSVPLAPGGPPSIQVSAFATGVPVGLLGIQFTPDPLVAGDYEISLGMKGGNEKTLFVTVVGDGT